MNARRVNCLESGNGQVIFVPNIDCVECVDLEKSNPSVETLAALLLSYGTPNAREISSYLIDLFGSLADLFNAGFDEVVFRSGVSPETAARISLVGQLCVATLNEEIRLRTAINSPQDLEKFARQRLGGSPIEEIILLLLDGGNGVIREQTLRTGSVNHVQLYPREVVRLALLYHASAVILIHNHPSGNSTPSSQDIETTEMISNSLAALGIALHEHLIVTRNAVVGMKAMKLV